MSQAERDRRDLPVTDHLEELRGTIIRSFAYVVVFSTAAWYFRQPLLHFLQAPAVEGARRAGIGHLPFRVFETTGAFMVAIQISLVAGIIVSSPLIIAEVWRYLAPGFDERELVYSKRVLPFAILLFAGGVALCYYVSPNAFAFLFRIDLSLGVEPERTLLPYLWFILRLMLGFGLAFELPLVLMFLGLIGLVTSRQLLGFWRQAVVIIFIFAALVTPTVDPVNMTVLAAPVFVLYLVSIALVHALPSGRARAGDDESGVAEAADDPTVPVYDAARERERETELFYGERGAEATEGDVEIPTPEAEGPADADSGEESPPV